MRFIKINEDNIVIQVRNGNSLIEGEIQSLTGNIGQKMNDDGTFSDVEKEEINNVDMYQQLLMENQYQTFLLETILLGGE